MGDALIPVPPSKCETEGHAWHTPTNGVSTGPTTCRRCGERK